MAEISWIKIKTNIFDDEKIKLIEAMPEADTVLIIWFKLLVQAGKCNDNGDISLTNNIPYSIEMLATIFNRPLQTVKYGVKILLDMSLIEMSESNVISISNWEKHQNIDGMEKIREQNRLRQQNYRDQKRLNKAKKDNKSNVTVTQHNAIDKDIELDKEIKNLFVETSNEFRLAKLLFDLILENNPDAKQPNLQVWAKSIDLMIRKDNRTIEQIEGAIRWCQQDQFWHKNILSTDKLRKQYDRIYLEAKNARTKREPNQPVITENELRKFSESIFNDPRYRK